MRRKTSEEGPRRGINWRMVLHTVGVGVIIWAAGIFLGVALGNDPSFVLFYVPAALVTVLAYYRSEQKTRAQGIAEAIFTGAVFMVILQILSILLSAFLFTAGQTGGQ
ncbi:MAG: hypothetical protein HYX86_03585 [Chloroflexi bacterium]|nr:hypothetical protein [Chloroflexota bacterium]